MVASPGHIATVGPVAGSWLRRAGAGSGERTRHKEVEEMKSNRAKSARAKKSFKEAVQGAKKQASYVGDLSSGYDANTPGIDENQNQHGKGHQEEVHKGGPGDGGAHFDDKRDETGKAAHSEGMRMLGQSLVKLEKEAKDNSLTDVQQSTLADTFKQLGREFDRVLDSPGALEGGYKSDSEILVSSRKDDAWIDVQASSDDDEWVEVEAAGHPSEDGARVHTEYEGRLVDEDAMKAEMWFKSGPGGFEDPRDEAERPTAKGTADHFS